MHLAARDQKAAAAADKQEEIIKLELGDFLCLQFLTRAEFGGIEVTHTAAKKHCDLNDI